MASFKHVFCQIFYVIEFIIKKKQYVGCCIYDIPMGYYFVHSVKLSSVCHPRVIIEYAGFVFACAIV